MPMFAVPPVTRASRRGWDGRAAVKGARRDRRPYRMQSRAGKRLMLPRLAELLAETGRRTVRRGHAGYGVLVPQKAAVEAPRSTAFFRYTSRSSTVFPGLILSLHGMCKRRLIHRLGAVHFVRLSAPLRAKGRRFTGCTCAVLQRTSPVTASSLGRAPALPSAPRSAIQDGRRREPFPQRAPPASAGPARVPIARIHPCKPVPLPLHRPRSAPLDGAPGGRPAPPEQAHAGHGRGNSRRLRHGRQRQHLLLT